MIIPKNKFRVGIIGPKPYLLGGHDSNNSLRKTTVNTIDRILTDLKSEYESLVGLTGLDLGIDQDFAKLCINHSIPYYCFLSHNNYEKLWGGIGDSQKQEMDALIKNSKGSISISEGNFSPKKMITKKLAIIAESNVIIYVKPDGLLTANSDPYLKEIDSKGKTVYIVKL